VAELIVVGGGMLGLTLALRLNERGHRITVLEGAAAPGGLAAPAELGGFTWDRFYHVMLESDAHLLGLLRSLGLEDRFRWGTTRTGFFTDGRFHSMSTSLEFLRFPPLGLIDKARLAGTIIHASRITDGLALERVTVESWLRTWSGDHTFTRIWRPLLEAKLGTNWTKASAAFIWAIIARMYAARRSGMKRERFGHVEGGYDTVLTALRAALTARGVTLRTDAPVSSVRHEGGRVAVQTPAGVIHVDAAVLTVASSRVSALVPQLSADERTRLARVEYQGVICASLLLDRPLAGYYVTNITDAGFPFTAVIEMTALVDRATFGGHTLVYLPRYCTQDESWWQRDDAGIRAEFLAALRRMYPDLTDANVKAFAVSRAREVMALPTLHYTRDALPPVATSVRGVFVVNSSQIVNGTLNTNESVALADRLAPVVADAVAR
jgi:protoporphyrinogen oxidase